MRKNKSPKEIKLPEAEWVIELLMAIDVPIFTAFEDHYISFISNLDVCTDGTGPHHGDLSPQDETAYYNGGKFLNADKDKYIVIPPQIRSAIDPVVMGCQARMTNLATGIWSAAVTGEIGPESKTGEAAYCLARLMNPSVSANNGDSRRLYLYELWPDVAAIVDGKEYKLEAG